MAVWRRKPKNKVLIHSDQGSQFTSTDWAAFLRAHNLEHSMSRRGNGHDSAVAESFFNLLKRERIRRRTCRTREDARQDVFDYIEMFYNPKRKHARNGMLSPAEFERQQKMRREGVHETWGYSSSACQHKDRAARGAAVPARNPAACETQEGCGLTLRLPLVAPAECPYRQDRSSMVDHPLAGRAARGHPAP